MYYDYSVLVIADVDFSNQCDDLDLYTERLKKVLTQRAGETPLRIVTVGGRYAFPGFEQQPTDDRTKTAFVKSIEDYLTQINEVVIVTNFQSDAFISAVTSKVDEVRKTTTVYRYKTRNEKS